MSRIFLSHSSANNAQAIALRNWLLAEGWHDLFLDLDPERGIAAGERWERALNEAARRCEAVLFLISKAWLSSRVCMSELTLARRLNKRLFGILIEEGLRVDDLPSDVASTWQLVNLAAGRDHKQFRVSLPITGEEIHVTYSLEGLTRLKTGLQRAGLHASYFNWPPELDPNRPPYRGLRPLEADDAGIFFGREAPIIEALDRLRGLREAAPPRLFVILGASGAGKSSFLRAGLLPRLARDDAMFLPLPIIRPERAPISGEAGLLRSLEGAFQAARLKTPRAELRTAIEGGAATLAPYLCTLAAEVTPVAVDGEARHKPPALVLSIDQGEELFLAESDTEARRFLELLHDLLATDNPAVIAVFTIRSDNYERLQEARELDGVHQEMLNLPPMPKGSYADVIKGPVRRLEGTPRALRIDDSLVDVLLAEVETGGAKDALPLLAFTLERLYEEYHAGGHLKLEHYEQLGRVKGSIEAAVERAFKAADADARVPKDRQARLTLLRRGFIPWLAGVDADTGAPRRRVARLSEIPPEAQPLVQHLVDQRLLATDVARESGEQTIEPVHEALLRQWGILQGWLAEDSGLLGILEGVKRASRDWAANGRNASWLTHGADRLKGAEGLRDRPDLAGNLEPTDWEYLAACRKVDDELRERTAKQEAQRRRLRRGLIAACFLGVLVVLSLMTQRNYENWIATRPWALLASIPQNEMHPLTNKPAQIGRRTPDLESFKFDVSLSPRDISRLHLLISQDRYASDQRSLFGTSINAEPLDYGVSRVLQDGDVIALSGSHAFRFFQIPWRGWHYFSVGSLDRHLKGVDLGRWYANQGAASPWGALIDGKTKLVYLLSQEGHVIRLSDDGQLTLDQDNARAAAPGALVMTLGHDRQGAQTPVACETLKPGRLLLVHDSGGACGKYSSWFSFSVRAGTLDAHVKDNDRYYTRYQLPLNKTIVGLWKRAAEQSESYVLPASQFVFEVPGKARFQVVALARDQ